MLRTYVCPGHAFVFDISHMPPTTRSDRASIRVYGTLVPEFSSLTALTSLYVRVEGLGMSINGLGFVVLGFGFRVVEESWWYRV